MRPFLLSLAVLASVSSCLAGARLPSRSGLFEENRGQFDDEVRFVSLQPSGALWLLRDGSALIASSDRAVRATMRLIGGAEAPSMRGLAAAAALSHYFVGADSSRWTTGVHSYERVRISEVYPGIDLEFYGQGDGFEYDFVLAPGADPNQIEVEVSGADEVSLTSEGDLLLESGEGELRHGRPRLFQGDQRISGRFVRTAENRFRFEVGEYDSARPLRIDPALLVSSYLGGSGQDFAQTIAYGPNNLLCIAGGTQSRNFPRAQGSQAPPQALRWTFVNCYEEAVAADGVYSRRLRDTYFIGGGADTIPWKMEIESNGVIYLLGDTTSEDLPVTANAHQSRYGGGSLDMWHAIILPAQGGGTFPLAPEGQPQQTKPTLAYSTYIGGAGVDKAQGSALGDCPGLPGTVCFYWTGHTTSSGLRSKGSVPTSPDRGAEDGVLGVSRAINTQRSAFEIALLMIYGGSGKDTDQQIGVGPGGELLFTFATESQGLPLQAPPGSNSGSTGGVSQGPGVFVVGLGPLEQTALREDADREQVTPLAFQSYFQLLLPAVQKVREAAARGEQQGRLRDWALFVHSSTPDGAHRFGWAHWNPSNNLEWFRNLPNPNGTDSLDLVGGAWTKSRGYAVLSCATRIPDFQNGNAGGRWDACFAYPSYEFLPGSDAIVTFLHSEDRLQEDPPPVVGVHLGGSGMDVPTDIAAGPAGLAISGFTDTGSSEAPNLNQPEGEPGTPGFPITANAGQRRYGGGSFDAFFVEFYQPLLERAAVLDAASFLEREVAPGSILTLFAFSVGPPNPIPLLLNDQGRVASQLGLTRVLFDGEPAPMVFTSRNQVSAIAPFRLAGKETTVLQIEFNGVVSNGVELQVSKATPGLFSLNQSGKGQAAVLNQDFTVNGPANPERIGGALQIFLTGGGQTEPPGVDGALAPSSEPLPRFLETVEVTIGGVEAQVLYAGAAPGLVHGVGQINVLIPVGVQPGPELPLVVEIGGEESQPGMTVAVAAR